MVEIRRSPPGMYKNPVNNEILTKYQPVSGISEPSTVFFWPPHFCRFVHTGCQQSNLSQVTPLSLQTAAPSNLLLANLGVKKTSTTKSIYKMGNLFKGGILYILLYLLYFPENYHGNGKSPFLIGHTSSNGCFLPIVMWVFGGVKRHIHGGTSVLSL